MSILQRIACVAGGRSLSAIQDDIRNEFEFHIATLTDELVKQGWSADDAKKEAERRFGNQDNIGRKCQSIQTGRLVWLTRIGVVGIATSFLTISCLTYFLLALVHQNHVLHEQLKFTKYESQKALSQAMETTLIGITPIGPGESGEFVQAGAAQNEKKETLKGKVTNAEGKPIPEAKVLLVHKSWPNNKFRMDHDVTETDKEGNYQFEDLYSTTGENQFLVTVFAQGNEMRSEYVSVKAKKKAAPVHFRLKPAKEITFQVLGPDKKPLAETDVVLVSRKVGTKEHIIYPLSSNDAKWQTDDKGKVALAFLNEGDTAKFSILIFGEGQEVEVKINSNAEQVIALEKKK